MTWLPRTNATSISEAVSILSGCNIEELKNPEPAEPWEIKNLEDAAALINTGICRNGWFSVRKRVVGEYSLCEKRWFSIESHLFLCYTRLIKSIRKKVVINLPSYPK